MKRKRGFLPTYDPRLAAGSANASSGSVHASGLGSTPLNLRSDLSDSEKEYYRALGLLPTASAFQVTPTAEPNAQLAALRGREDTKQGASVSGTLARELADRGDALKIRYTRGASNRAASSLTSQLNRRELLDALDDDIYAQSSKSSQASLFKTWRTLHTEWFGVGSGPLPLTPDSIRAVAALMKNRGYRSFQNFLSKAKREHITSGFEWSDALHLTGRECTRAVKRGQGPPRQSAALDLAQVCSLDLGPDPACLDGPINPKGMTIIGSFFMAREIEISLALVANFTVLDGPEILWRLPASKTDCQAVSVSRTWKCLCQGQPNYPCPAHEAVRHLTLLKSKFANSVGELPRDLPVFPTVSGRVATKEKVVATFECVGKSFGCPLVDSLGRRAFGGHSLRVSGAKHLAALGVDLLKISLLGRWASSVVLRYVSETPLVTLTEECRRLLVSKRADSFLEEIAHQCREGIRRISVLEEKLAISELEHQPTVKPDLATADQCRYILNCASGVWHVSTLHSSEVPPVCWHTRCGWKYASAVFEQASCFPKEEIGVRCCNKCMPEAAPSDSDTSSSGETD